MKAQRRGLAGPIVATAIAVIVVGSIGIGATTANAADSCGDRNSRCESTVGVITN